MAALTNFIPPSAFIAMCICSFAMFGLLLGWLCAFIWAQKWKDRDFVMNAVQQNGCALKLKYASDELKNDRAIVLAAVRQSHRALQFASDALKNNKDFMMVAVRRHGDALKYASDELKNDRAIVLAAVQQNGCAPSLNMPQMSLRMIEPLCWLR